MPSPLTPTKLLPHCELEPANEWHHIPVKTPLNTESVPHDVKDGENWQRIASYPKYKDAIAKYREKIQDELVDLPDELANARALIHFNFNTMVPEYVNWYLLNYVCCYSATEDRTNRRFSSTDKDRPSPMFGRLDRAGTIYVPKMNAVPKKTTPALRKVKFWSHLAYHDGLLTQLNDLYGQADNAADLLQFVEDEFKKAGKVWSNDELRKIARLKKYAKPLKKLLKALGRVSKVVDLLTFRFLHGYLVMTYDTPADTHYSWEISMALKGDEYFGEDEGEFSTNSDKYTIRTTVFDPTKEWTTRKVSATLAFNSFAISVRHAFKMYPHNKSYRAIEGDRIVNTGSGPLDWTISMPPLRTQSKYGFFTTVPPFYGSITDGKFRSFIDVAGPLLK